MSPEVRKRTRPCASCKLSKVKCEYTTSLPCKRCLKLGIVCQFANEARSVPSPIPIELLQNSGALAAEFSGVRTSFSNSEIRPNIVQTTVPPKMNKMDNYGPANTGWAHLVDSRLNSFESTLETILSVLQTNRIEQQSRMDFLQSEINTQATLATSLLNAQGNIQIPNLSNLSELESSLSVSQAQALHQNHSQQHSKRNKQQRNQHLTNNIGGNPGTQVKLVTDFRLDNIITKDEASMLLDHFIKNFSPHLFGYILDELDVEKLWEKSPLLLISICTVSCGYHSLLAEKFEALRDSLNWFASRVLINAESDTDVEHTILGLVIASLWLSSARMFSGLALQLARTWRVDQLKSSRLEKLWCLLYVLDGTENLTTHKSPSLYKDVEPLVKGSRKRTIEYLDEETNKNHFFKKALFQNSQTNQNIATHKQLELLNEVDNKKFKLKEPTFQNLRLLTQLEYHMAMESVFHNKNIELSTLHTESLEATMALLPSEKFGIPWQSNMDLDKWMISWTIALQNVKIQNDPWCLKSTLLYYNFARMHINTRALLQGKKSHLLESPPEIELMKLWYPHVEDEHIPISDTELEATKEVSRSAAVSLLKLITKDKDLTKVFQFFPVHVYIMLYYAALVAINPNDILDRTDKQSKECFTLVSNLRRILESTIIPDLSLRKNLILHLSHLLQGFKEEYSKQVHNPKKISELFEKAEEEEERREERKPRQILAWPDTNPGHP